MNGLPEMYDPADAEPRRRYEDHDLDLREDDTPFPDPEKARQAKFERIIAEANYRSYRANREMAPHRKPEDFARFYPGCDVQAFEERFQRERGA